MSGNELDLKFGAGLASNVYLINDVFIRRGFEIKYKNIFDIGRSSMVKGCLGVFLIVVFLIIK